MKKSAEKLYGQDFYDEIEQGSLQSAAIIVPRLVSLVRPQSVLDVGCGRGAWLAIFQNLGISKILGIDGAHVDRARLLIPSEFFESLDLNRPFELSGRHDLVLCLEVAEHLPASMAHSLVKTLTKAAPVIVFSAAIPGQGGTGHVNEQWPEYWRRLFAKEGFEALDPIRKHVWQNESVQWWYRQNLLVYANAEALNRSEELRSSRIGQKELLPWVHAGILQRLTGPLGLTRELPAAIQRGVRNRLCVYRTR